jgi:hypothetical protein
MSQSIPETRWAAHRNAITQNTKFPCGARRNEGSIDDGVVEYSDGMLARTRACGDRKSKLKKKERTAQRGIAHVRYRHVGVVGPIIPAEENMPGSQTAAQSESKNTTLQANSDGILARTREATPRMLLRSWWESKVGSQEHRPYTHQ